MQLLHGDCAELLKTLPSNSISSVVTDPPYGLGFMSLAWDKTDIANDVALWREVLRVLKPGGHLAAFGGTRTYHRMACAIEDAGFEIRDQIQWIYSSGFPKSRNPEGRWKGWGTGLKPANEPIVLARKPLSERTVEENLARWDAGALHIDACRVGDEPRFMPPAMQNSERRVPILKSTGFYPGRWVQGRWPANVIHDDSDEATADFPGSAFRFYYCAKASKDDRDAGLEQRRVGSVGHGNLGNSFERFETRGRNTHPTVKPTALMRYLCRLVTAPGGIVLDPFMGSGSTGKAAILEGFDFVGMEQQREYFEIASQRIEAAQKEFSASRKCDDVHKATSS